jgi:hypothetical protein
MADTSNSRRFTLPRVARDPRFRAGRKLVQSGQAEQAVALFASLLEECRTTYGEAHIEAAPAYYEYGNAIFRAFPPPGEEVEESDRGESSVSKSPHVRDAAAAAAERRAQDTSNMTTDSADAINNHHIEEVKPENLITGVDQVETETGVGTIDESTDENDTADDDDRRLALEMMETCWSILDEYLASVDSESSAEVSYCSWATDQVPRVLTGIGDVFSSLQRHADAADTYCRALGHRQTALEAFSEKELSIEFLQSRRRVVEANVLIAEELLACPVGEDVVTSESKDTLVQAAERVDFARGYYDRARDQLQETVLLMGQMAAKGADIQQEKEDICFASTMVMGVGMILAELDEQAAEKNTEPVKKKGRHK